jgi:hypothetical protein
MQQFNLSDRLAKRILMTVCTYEQVKMPDFATKKEKTKL